MLARWDFSAEEKPGKEKEKGRFGASGVGPAVLFSGVVQSGGGHSKKRLWAWGHLLGLLPGGAHGKE